MFKISNNMIELTRGDSVVIELSIEDYSFEIGDVIEFRVYKKKKLNEIPLINKVVEVREERETVEIELSSEDTKIGEISNNPTEYWYEIELNNNKTILGYDDEGAKILKLYPEGAEKDD